MRQALNNWSADTHKMEVFLSWCIRIESELEKRKLEKRRIPATVKGHLSELVLKPNENLKKNSSRIYEFK